jgi:hypothetical protein
MFERLKVLGFDILTLHHAEAILSQDIPDAASELEAALESFSIPVIELVRGGGGEAEFTQRLRKDLTGTYGWVKHNFKICKTVDDRPTESISHEIDHVKNFSSGTCALEIEWNNKDPFFDRDLENFKRLHTEGAISVGMIVTRGQSLHDDLRKIIASFASTSGVDSIEKLRQYYNPTIRQRDIINKAIQRHGSFSEGWAHAFVSDKFGEATTHWRKLQDRVQRGVGSPCPLLLMGIPSRVVRT